MGNKCVGRATTVSGKPAIRVNTFAAGWNDACTGALQFANCTVIGTARAKDYLDGWKDAKRRKAGPEFTFNQTVELRKQR